MAAYGSFHRLFENTRQNSKSLLDTLSSSSPWNPTNGLNATTDHDETPPFTEIFGELHFMESSHSSYEKTSAENNSLQLCTEGLGSESYYDLEDGNDEDDENEVEGKENRSGDYEEKWGQRKKVRREYPPAMTRMSFKTYREEGRFVLEEVKIPRKEFLRAIREDGRLRLKLVQLEDDIDEVEEQEKEITDS